MRDLFHIRADNQESEVPRRGADAGAGMGRAGAAGSEEMEDRGKRRT
jgi:hypothetical protein